MSDLLVAVAKALPRVVEPLVRALVSPDHLRMLVDRFGWAADELATSSMELVRSRLGLQGLLDGVEQLAEDLESGTADSLAIALDLIDKFALIADAIRQLGSVQRTDLPFPLDQQELWQELPVQLVDDLLVAYLENEKDVLFGAMLLLGVIEIELVEPKGRNRKRYLRRLVRWDLLERLADPIALLRDAYGWGDSAGFDHPRLLQSLARFLWALSVEARLRLPSQALLNQHYAQTSQYRALVRELRVPIIREGSIDEQGYVEAGLSLLPVPAQKGGDTPPAGLFLEAYLEGTAASTGAEGTGPGFFVELAGRFESGAGFGVALYPGEVRLEGVVGASLIEARAGFSGTRAAPWILLGTRDSHRIELYGVRAEIAVRGQLADPEFVLALGTGPEPNPPKLAFVLQLGEGDGFLNKIVGTEPQRFEFGGLLTWSSKTGLSLSGQAELACTIPLNKKIGIVEMETLTVALATTGKELELVVAATGSATLGPLAASVDRVGVKLTLKKAEAGDRRVFGDLALTFGFKPPDGLGLVVDAGPVSGGGFLSIDTANGRYTGVLQLNLGKTIAITAIGLLDTKLPGGVKGFSFLIIITAKFSPIQLGFGFALTGLGGLAGIHRSIVVQALQDGVRSHSLDHILFPVDPVKNAQKLISDLQAFFPPTEGSYVFGPMASISWGTPVIIEAELGIILQLPNPLVVVILGQVNVILPDREAPVAAVVLHIDIVGSIDFTNQNLSIDASLHDSKLLQFSLYGDMALRLSWGKEPNFALSVGGLHPQFQPPPDFPTTLKRLTVALGAGENPRFSLQTYLAVTSNTVQFGALAELYAEAAGFNVYGWIGFDVLFIFTPFSLTADFSAGVALRKGSTVLASVHLAATLTGPTPWHAWGEASISILFLKATVSFDAVFGEEAQLDAPLVDPWPVLEAEIRKTGNWSATLPPASSQVVALTAPGADEPGLALIDPLGGLTLREKAVPFDRTLTKFGEGKLAQPQRFTIGGVTIGTQPATTGNAVLDYFSPGQVEDMTDAQKLSRSSFEQMQAGVMIASDAVAFGAVKGTEYEYETVIIDKPDAKGREAQAYTLKVNHQAVSLQRSAAAQSPLRTTGLDKFAPAPSEPALAMLAEEEYVVVDTITYFERTDISSSSPKTKGAAYRSLADHLATNPKDKGQLEVVPLHELRKAA